MEEEKAEVLPDELPKTDEYISKALATFDISRAAIQELSDQYLPLVTNGTEDKVAYDLVHTARMDIKRLRVQVGKTRKGLLEESKKYTNSVNDRAKQITAMLEPIETHLTEQEDLVDNEKERIRTEKVEAERLIVKARTDGLYEAGMSFNGSVYVYGEITVIPETLSTMTEQEYHIIIDQIGRAKEAEAIEKVESDRVAVEAASLLAEEARKLEETRKAQEKQSEALELERKKIQDEKDAIEETKRLAQEAAELKEQEAYKVKVKAERLEKETKERLEKEAADAKQEEERVTAEKIAKEENDRLEAELTEKLKPDKEKLSAVSNELTEIMEHLLDLELEHAPSKERATRAADKMREAIDLLI